MNDGECFSCFNIKQIQRKKITRIYRRQFGMWNSRQVFSLRYICHDGKHDKFPYAWKSTHMVWCVIAGMIWCDCFRVNIHSKWFLMLSALNVGEIKMWSSHHHYFINIKRLWGQLIVLFVCKICSNFFYISFLLTAGNRRKII